MLLIASTGISVGVPGVAAGSGPLDGFVGSAGGTVPCPGSGSVASFFTKATLLTAGIPVKFSLTVTTKLNDVVCPKSILIPVNSTVVPFEVPPLPAETKVVPAGIASDTDKSVKF